MQEKKFESSAFFQAAINHYRNLPFLIIDEVTEGSGKDGFLAEWEKSILFSVIDARYQERKCTLIISNRTQADLLERLGQPIIDRLSENAIRLGFDWPSYRINRSNQPKL